MPTYDYECRACGETVEIFHAVSDAPKTKCPRCGKRKLARLIGGGAGFIFKGSGFYITDYRSEDYKAKAKAESESTSKSPSDSSKTASGDSTTGETSEKKPDKKSETPATKGGDKPTKASS